ncbi:hypothetical protein [Agromyces seonyuensis]|uniref:F5/8 type C domain-containing protein n=1 Tax=Agromyces seonyuensis TaxID=2662446 RepID=A0A6I4NS26_9MICO|nr:hypothetical protein [Agromyces seonyuensis]MWB97278.1 hypothetical protein [Agromyces seonyuensis]
MRRTARGAIAAVSVISVAVVVGIVVAAASGPPARNADSAAPPATPVDAEWTPVCGFAGNLVNKLVADSPESSPTPAPLETVVADLGIDDGGPSQLLVSDAGILLRFDGDDRIVRYGLDGRAEGSFDLDLRSDPDSRPVPPAALTDDGRLFVLDLWDGRRAVVEYDLGGRRVGGFDVPATEETTDDPWNVIGLALLDDVDGSPALVVNEGEETTSLFRLDGTPLGTREGPIGPFGSGTVSYGADGMLRIADEVGGDPVAQFRLGDPPDGDAEAQQAPYRQYEVDVVPSPDGVGALLYSADAGIESVDAVGVRRAIWPSSEFPDTLVGDGGMVVHGGDAYLLVRNEDEGIVALARITPERLAAGLAAPVGLTASTEGQLAQLGLGIGPVTDHSEGHFDDGDEPAVAVRFDPGWGEVGDERPGEDYELVVRVTGDPLAAEPIVSEPEVLPAAVGGGDVPVTLPGAEPGPYLVDMALRERGSDEYVSGACLHYTVGAPGVELAMDGLDGEAGWGGAAPLRGVELADRLGIGSHRVQLDFGALVPDPASEPDADAIQWEGLPGAADDEDGGPFGELVAAARAARDDDVKLIVQVGQNSEAELAAAEAGTWGGWSELIVAGISERTGIRYWEPWNEPNLAIGGGDYARGVAAPFQAAAHAADPEAVVIEGNTLGFAGDWWPEAVDAGICDDADVVGVHPYTGWYRSWEEEGFAADGDGYDAFRETLGDGCGELPLWDTETGWTSDGPANYWAQGAMTARKLVWNRLEGIDEWTYFFSEGAWGEAGLSWSLVQAWSYVKPAGLAMAATSALLEDAPAPTQLDTGIPFVYAAEFGGERPLTAFWSDDLRTSAVVETGADRLVVIDQYGGRRTVDVVDGRAEVVVTGALQFLDAGDADVRLSPTESFGADVLKGLPVQATSTHEGLDPDVITSGTADVDRAWRAGVLADGSIDEAPAVEIALARPTTIDRIAVASPAILCCESGLRDYELSVQTADGGWQVVATQEGQFHDRIALFAIEPIEATAVRLTIPRTLVRDTEILSVNYGSFAGGLPPPFFGLSATSDYFAAVSAISAWAPGA